MNFLGPYFRGMKVVFQGTKDIFSIPGLLAWAIIPFIIDLLILIFGFHWGKGQIPGWRDKVMGLVFSDPSGWIYTLLSPVLSLLFWMAFIGVLLYGTFLLATIVASPFNAIIAEKTLSHYGFLQNSPFNWAQWVTVSLRMFLISLIRVIVFAIIGVVLFILSFIPLLNLLASFVTFLIIAFDCMDYSFEVKQMSLSQRFKYFKNHLPEFCGMATMLGFSLLVPGLTLLLLPSSVAGSAWVMCQIGDPCDPDTSA